MTQPCGFCRQLIWQRMAHNPEVAGSNPAPATGKALETGPFCFHRGDHGRELSAQFLPGCPYPGGASGASGHLSGSSPSGPAWLGLPPCAVMPLDAGLDVSGNVKPDEVSETTNQGSRAKRQPLARVRPEMTAPGIS